MIHLFLAGMAAFLFLVLTLPILFVLWLIGKNDPDKRDNIAFKMVRWIFRVIIVLSGIKLTVIGEENIPKDQGVVYIANHRSIFDIVITFSRFFAPTCIVAKKELERIPIFKTWLLYNKALLLDRNDLRQGMETIKKATDLAKNGTSVLIFPEGHRSKSEDECKMLEFHEGSFRISTRSGCPVVPVALHNTREILEAHFPKIKGTHVTVEYLPPIYPETLSREDQKRLGATCREKISETLKRYK